MYVFQSEQAIMTLESPRWYFFSRHWI